LAYFDLPYNAMVLVVLARSWLERQAWMSKQPINSSLAVAGAVKP